MKLFNSFFVLIGLALIFSACDDEASLGTDAQLSIESSSQVEASSSDVLVASSSSVVFDTLEDLSSSTLDSLDIEQESSSSKLSSGETMQSSCAMALSSSIKASSSSRTLESSSSFIGSSSSVQVLSSSSLPKSSSSVTPGSSSSIPKSSSSKTNLLSSSSFYDGSNLNTTKKLLTDYRDGNTYKVTKINGLWWMSENLKYNYNEGKAVSRCYERASVNCETYGRLYRWSAAMDSAGKFSKNGTGCGYTASCNAGKPAGYRYRGVCPKDWYIPTRDDLKALLDYAIKKAGSDTAGNRDLVAKSEGGHDLYGFSALFGGYYSWDTDAAQGEDMYYGIEYETNFWSSTEESSLPKKEAAYLHLVSSSKYKPHVFDNGGKRSLFSVRCVKPVQ